MRRLVSIAASAWAGAMLSAPVIAEDAPGPPATISVAVAPDEPGYPTQVFVRAMGEALAARGFTVLEEPGHARLVADLRVIQEDVGTAAVHVPTGRSAVAPGLAPGVGAGLVVPLPTGKSSLVPLRRTRLDVRIRRQGQANIVWRGAAITVRAAGTRTGGDAVVASALSDALFRDYPAQPTDVVSVP